ncbi:MAG: hypothetical protein OXE59_06085 [Bacteroidetes bacterium]|nr:hypothetical protein [Bacteroidota bacterium]MCY4233293.1 hypothetical protein [Bacteroidota bacterium]
MDNIPDIIVAVTIVSSYFAIFFPLIRMIIGFRKEFRAEMTFIKTDILQVKTDITVMKSDISELKTDVSQLKTDVSKLKTDVSQLKTDVSENKFRLTTVENCLENLTADVNHIKVDVSTIKSEITEIKMNAISLEKDVSHINSQVNEDRLISQKEHLDLEKTIEELTKKVFDLNGDMKRVSGRLFGVDEQIISELTE